MKTLSDLTMDEYIRILDGDTKLLRCPIDERAKAIEDLQYEFNRIASPKGAAMQLAEAGDKARLQSTILLMSICKVLCTCDAVDDVKIILSELGINAKPLSRSSIIAVINERQKRANDELQEHKQRGFDEPRSARSVYEKLTATLMSHFKFQIDLRSISASLYANLIAQCESETKAIMASIKK